MEHKLIRWEVVDAEKSFVIAPMGLWAWTNTTQPPASKDLQGHHVTHCFEKQATMSPTQNMFSVSAGTMCLAHARPMALPVSGLECFENTLPQWNARSLPLYEARRPTYKNHPYSQRSSDFQRVRRMSCASRSCSRFAWVVLSGRTVSLGSFSESRDIVI